MSTLLGSVGAWKCFCAAGSLCVATTIVHIDVDKCRSARTVAARRVLTLSMQYPELFPADAWADAFVLPQDAATIQPPHLRGIDIYNGAQWVFIAGFECTDLSTAGSGKGFEGAKSGPTYNAMMKTLGGLQQEQKARPPIYFVENTFPHTAPPANVIAALNTLHNSLGQEVALDAARVGSYAHRLRNYWTNLADPIALQTVLNSFERDPSLNLRTVLDHGRTPQICVHARKYPWYPANVPNQELKVLPTLVARPHSWNWSVFKIADGSTRIGEGLVREGDSLVDLTMEERERVMGYEAGCTEGVSDSARHQLTGATFDALAVSTLSVVGHCLGPSPA